MKNKYIDWPVVWSGVGVLLVCTLVVLAGWAIYADAKAWDSYKAEHNCEIVAKVKGDTITTVAPILSGNGGIAVGVSTTPSKTGWLCDDGVTYYR